MSLLHDLMGKAGIKSLSELRRRSEVHENVFSNWVTGRYDPTLDPLTRMAEVLGCTPGQALDALIDERQKRKLGDITPAPPA